MSAEMPSNDYYERARKDLAEMLTPEYEAISPGLGAERAERAAANLVARARQADEAWFNGQRNA